jgi:hypothetical protein
MTLLLAAGNAQFVSLAADRRITRDGRLENDEQSRELTNVTLGGKPLQFSSYTYQPNEDGVLSQSSGVPPSALAWETARLARSCADPQVQPGHIVRRLVRTIQTFSGSKTAGGLVGAQCNTATVPSDADTPIHTTYHSAHESLAAYSADVVMTFSNGDGMALAGIEILSSGKFFLAGPKIAKRNHCWCGSGREFRHCHLRIMGSVYAKLPGPSFPRPTPFFVRLRRAPGSGPSGEVFLVRSSLE